MTLARALVEWAWSLTPSDLPPAAGKAVRRHLLDGIGTAVAASRTEAIPSALAVAGDRLPAEATILGDGRRVATQAAALANGALVHALDYDDTHGGALVHPTAVVLPVALAVGEQVAATGAEVLTAAAAGYETVIRLGQAVRHGFHARGFHATSVCGVFAAALVASRLLGLDPARAVHALGIAGSLASGSLEFLHTGASTKQLHPGFAAANGLLAAQLAAAGAQGPDSILEGRFGLYRSYAGADVEPATVLTDLGKRWELEAITIKPYPACQLSHAGLDALTTLLDRIPSPSAVTAVTFRVPDDSVPIVCEPAASKHAPRSVYEAKFSLQWCAAALLLDGQVGVETFDVQRLGREDARELARRVAYEPFAFDGPAAGAPGHVTVVLDDGHVLTGEVPVSRGGPDAPLSDEQLLGKFRGNCGTGVGDPARLAALVLGLHELDDVSELAGATVRPDAPQETA